MDTSAPSTMWPQVATTSMIPQSISFVPMTQPGPQRMVPVIAPMHLQNGRMPEFFQVPYPMLLPNGMVQGGPRGMHTHGSTYPGAGIVSFYLHPLIPTASISVKSLKGTEAYGKELS